MATIEKLCARGVYDPPGYSQLIGDLKRPQRRVIRRRRGDSPASPSRR